MLDLVQELTDVIACLDQGGVPYALCGGLAMAVHGYPRATVDIDLLVLAKDEAAATRTTSSNFAVTSNDRRHVGKSDHGSPSIGIVTCRALPRARKGAGETGGRR
ncbi:MAG: hypothetical protein ABUS79_21050 [Pseudomonadota bacterium]